MTERRQRRHTRRSQARRAMFSDSDEDVEMEVGSTVMTRSRAAARSSRRGARARSSAGHTPPASAASTSAQSPAGATAAPTARSRRTSGAASRSRRKETSAGASSGASKRTAAARSGGASSRSSKSNPQSAGPSDSPAGVTGQRVRRKARRGPRQTPSRAQGAASDNCADEDNGGDMEMEMDNSSEGEEHWASTPASTPSKQRGTRRGQRAATTDKQHGSEAASPQETKQAAAAVPSGIDSGAREAGASTSVLEVTSSGQDAPPPPPPEEQYSALLAAAFQCSQRGLVMGSQWLLELATSLPCEDAEHPPTITLEGLAPAETGTYFLAKAFFDASEFKRCAHALSSCVSTAAVFLRLYAVYLAGEQQKEEAKPNVLEYAASHATNKNLRSIRSQIQDRLMRRQACDAFLHYLLGIVLRDMGVPKEARSHLVDAVNAQPLLWPAWYALASLCKDKAHVNALNAVLPHHWMKRHFLAHVALELRLDVEALELYVALEPSYPKSSDIAAQIGTAYHNLRDVEMAEEYFARVEALDPYRLNHVDTYSNVLYLQENVAELSRLAHHVASIDKYRPETCCVIGNYYSRRELSSKAEIYFRRAIKLDRKCLSAWTLLGHEYIELRNAPAAIVALRRAVDINPRDFRGWSNLGYAYDLLEMPMYSLHYYKRALRLRPYDRRIWDALAGVYQHLGQHQQAIRCLENILSFNEDDVGVLHRIADIYRNGTWPPNDDKAAFYYLKTISLDDTGNIIISDENIVEACEFLSDYFMRRNDREQVEKYANVLISYGGKPKQRAKELLRQLHSSKPGDRSRVMDPSPTRAFRSVDLFRSPFSLVSTPQAQPLPPAQSSPLPVPSAARAVVPPDSSGGGRSGGGGDDDDDMELDISTEDMSD